MRFMTALSAILLGITVAFLATRRDSHAQAPVDAVYPMTYHIVDLPVWSSDGKVFDPSILVALLKTVDPPAWKGNSSIAPIPDRHSLVVSTTSANHREIGTIMKRLKEKPQSNY